MKKLALLLCFIIFQTSVFASTTVFSEGGKFGLKDDIGNIVVEAKYKKLIRLGKSAWIMQKGSRFGIISNDGKVLVDSKYSYADRILGRFAKFQKGDKVGIFDERGSIIIPIEYSSIDLLYGGMFLTYKNYKYGIMDLNGQVIIDNVCDDIFMPKPNQMIISYNGQVFEIERVRDDNGELSLPVDFALANEDSRFRITELIDNPMATTGYYSVSATNYCLKVFSSISPAYEQTIDELMFSQGADAANVIMKFSWLPRFPFVYAKKYYKNLTAPNNGPLHGVKTNLKRHMND